MLRGAWNKHPCATTPKGKTFACDMHRQNDTKQSRRHTKTHRKVTRIPDWNYETNKSNSPLILSSRGRHNQHSSKTSKRCKQNRQLKQTKKDTNGANKTQQTDVQTCNINHATTKYRYNLDNPRDNHTFTMAIQVRADRVRSCWICNSSRHV